MAAPVVWLASYPRSGNTFLRTLLLHRFGLRSGSVYGREFHHNEPLGQQVGHLDPDDSGRFDFGDAPVYLMKTHGLNSDDRKAIYVIRDGRKVTMSMHTYYKGTLPLPAIIRGQHIFGTWRGHLDSWRPSSRANTLLLRYEDMMADLPAAVARIAGHLGVTPNDRPMPDRDAIADDHIVRRADAERPALEGEALDLFWQVNGEAMRTFGYA